TIPLTFIHIDGAHFNSVRTRIDHNLRRRIKPHRLTVEQRGTEHRRMMPFRSEEHTSELQSRRDLVCRLLLEKKKKLSHTVFLFVSTADDVDGHAIVTKPPHPRLPPRLYFVLASTGFILDDAFMRMMP